MQPAGKGRCPGDQSVADLLGGTLTRADRAELLEHAADCADCRALLSELAAGDEAPAGPETIDRYTLLRTIGAGGMGVVYLAHDRELDREVALKVLRDDLADAARKTALLREARAMAKLAHPNVVRVFDVGEHDGRVFLTMELARDGTLRDHLAGGLRPFAAIAPIFEGAGRGLAAAHAAGVVHRDFKPENVLLRDGQALVTDFGLARVVDDGPAGTEARMGAAPNASGSGTRSTAIVGTLPYMAPEQLRGERADARSDVFGYSVALWEALHGTKPFAGQAPAELLGAIARGPVAPSKRADVPAAVIAALRAGLAFDAAQRPASMDVLLAALFAGPAPRLTRRLTLVGALAVGVGIAVVVTRESVSSLTTLTAGAAWRDPRPAPATPAPSASAVPATPPTAPLAASSTAAAPATSRPGPTPGVARAVPTAVADVPARAAPSSSAAALPPPSARGPGGVFVRPPF